ncbi:hypothetical protein GQ43DRAFT_459093 [Delitschia confertaspora ATCC 74209]|uniref:Copper transport protein n=1 Tax=Delitschia confertaspora ATCC 74209 TaxID=1513339 RepID=A0A9P4MKZ6_9PLEO|nr:hypothetical protein GQ43DRAFT_459093 [Delitschia confertaspora ATCC 74209]
MAPHDGHSMSGMDMATDSSTSSGMQGMSSTFFSGTTTPLYSAQWVPSTAGAYAGTCIFLIIFAMLFRGGFALKHYLEIRWLASARKRKYVVVADKTPISEQIKADADSTTGILTTNGVEESIRLIQAPISHVQPWRFSVDFPRALLVMVLVGCAYLLMLAVMTFNVGYYISIVGGTFIGELIFGRYSQAWGHDH